MLDGIGRKKAISLKAKVLKKRIIENPLASVSSKGKIHVGVHPTTSIETLREI